MSKEIKAFGDRVLAEMVDKPEGFKKSSGGIFIADKDGDVSGIRPRWFRVEKVGEKVDFLSEGQYVLVAHGRWSQGIKIDDEQTLYLLDNEECLAVSDTNPLDD